VQQDLQDQQEIQVIQELKVQRVRQVHKDLEVHQDHKVLKVRKVVQDTLVQHKVLQEIQVLKGLKVQQVQQDQVELVMPTWYGQTVLNIHYVIIHTVVVRSTIIQQFHGVDVLTYSYIPLQIVVSGPQVQGT
jgi:hypothetical protein